MLENGAEVSPEEMADKRRTLITRYVHSSVAVYDIIRRLDNTDNVFPSTFLYFQKKVLVEKEVEEIRRSMRERIAAEEEENKNHRLDYIARLEYMYNRAIAEGDIPNARLLSRDLAETRGVNTDMSGSSDAGLPLLLRQVSKMGLKVMREEAAAREQGIIDVTPTADPLSEAAGESQSTEDEAALAPMKGVTASPAASKALSILEVSRKA